MGRFYVSGNLPSDGFAEKIAAQVWRFDGNSGLTRVNAGFPLKPGMLTDADLGKVRVFVGPTEKRVALSPLRGKHPDGSYRALGIQFEHGVSSLPQEAEVWFNGTILRQTEDIAWEEPTAESVGRKAVIAPTDPQYLCDSYVALMPLQPESSDTGKAVTYFGTTSGELAEWLAFMDGLSPTGTFQSTYEHVHGLMEVWLRTGSQTAYERWYTWLYAQMTQDYFNINETKAPDAFAKVMAPDPTLTPPVSTEAAGLPNEQNSVVYAGWATGYLLTAWKQPWRQLAHKVSANFAGAFSLGANDLLRRNMYQRAMPGLVGYCVEVTMQVPSQFGGYGAGRDPNTQTYAAQLPSILTALEAGKYSGYESGYLDGIVGQLQTSYDANVGFTGGFPLFMLMISSRVLMWYYNNIAPDSRIPVWIKTMADVVIAQGTPNGDEAYWPYLTTDPLGSPPPAAGNTQPYWAAFYSELFGFMYAYETDPTDKATYLEWLNRALTRESVDTNSFTKNGKAFGEYFAMHGSAAYYLAGGTVRGITGAHPTVITEPSIWGS